ncbi:MAG: hypothetical protein ACOYBY_06765 [Dermatophilaceae bacterium]
MNRPVPVSSRTSLVRRGLVLVTAVGALLLAGAGALAFALTSDLDRNARCVAERTVVTGATWVVPERTCLRSLTLQEGGTITAPTGYSVTLTVNGVETGQRLVTTKGTATAIQPGTYRGHIVLTLTVATSVTWPVPGPPGTPPLSFPLRQALWVGPGGVDESRSVLAAVVGGRTTASSARDITVRSRGEGFNGVYVKDATYTLARARLSLVGNGRYDFVGAGAAVVASGAATRLLVKDTTITNEGAVRTGLVATDGSNVIVKDSTIRTHDGVLPSDFQPTIFPGQMRSAPWMLGIVGNVRATNLAGANTKATYIGSDVSSTGWGVLSTDSVSNGQLTAINSRISTGSEGYGTYADGQSVTDRFLGTTFTVDDYAAISTGGDVHFGDSGKDAVSALNAALDLRLTPLELAHLPVQNTVVRSNRFGVMWHGGGQPNVDGGTVSIDGGTVVDTAKTTFVDKGLQVALTVDGSEGARLHAGNGVIWQLMDSDDPGPVVVKGDLVNQGVYHEPTDAPVKDPTFDVTTAHPDDAVANLRHITVRGDFYNGLRATKNLVLTLDGAAVTGVLSSSSARHAMGTITSADYKQISEVTNTVGATVNNGVVVSLPSGSTWTATGTSYLSRLAVSADSSVRAADGRRVSMTVDGVPTAIVPGQTHSGAIVVTVG